MQSLRELSVDRQVGLLFLIVFGTLLVATAAVVLYALRERRGEAGVDPLPRIERELAVAWTGAALFWLAWISGAPGATLLFAIVSFLALREFITLQHTRRSDHRSLLLAFFGVLPLQYAIVGTRAFDLFSVFIPVYVFFALPVVSALAGDPERFLERNAKIQWGIMVCVYGLSHAPALLLLEFPRYEGRGAFLLLFLVLVIVIAQFAQEAAAARMRRRPLARHISRSFSWRGLGVGALAGAAAGLLFHWITPFRPGQALVIGAVTAAAGALGRFVMQALKRDAGVHYWGNAASVTGAVGLLDRVAPLCFAAPVFFHSLRWYFKLAF